MIESIANVNHRLNLRPIKEKDCSQTLSLTSDESGPTKRIQKGRGRQEEKLKHYHKSVSADHAIASAHPTSED